MTQLAGNKEIWLVHLRVVQSHSKYFSKLLYEVLHGLMNETNNRRVKHFIWHFRTAMCWRCRRSMSRSAGVPPRHKRLSSKDPSDRTFSLEQWMFALRLPARRVPLQHSCPSVYLSFILETQTDGKWINKDWAKIGSGCVCSAGHVGRLCTDSQSVSEDWVTARGSGAGRTLMGVMLMSSEPINKPSPLLRSPLISTRLFYTLTGRMIFAVLPGPTWS